MVVCNLMTCSTGKHFQKHSEKHFCLSVVPTKKQLQKQLQKSGDFNHQQLMQKYLQNNNCICWHGIDFLFLINHQILLQENKKMYCEISQTIIKKQKWLKFTQLLHVTFCFFVAYLNSQQRFFCLSVVITRNLYYYGWIKPGDFNHQQLMQKKKQTQKYIPIASSILIFTT